MKYRFSVLFLWLPTPTQVQTILETIWMLCPHLGKHDFYKATTHNESTLFNAKPMDLQEEPDNLIFPNFAL